MSRSSGALQPSHCFDPLAGMLKREFASDNSRRIIPLFIVARSLNWFEYRFLVLSLTDGNATTSDRTEPEPRRMDGPFA